MRSYIHVRSARREGCIHACVSMPCSEVDHLCLQANDQPSSLTHYVAVYTLRYAIHVQRTRTITDRRRVQNRSVAKPGLLQGSTISSASKPRQAQRLTRLLKPFHVHIRIQPQRFQRRNKNRVAEYRQTAMDCLDFGAAVDIDSAQDWQR